MNTQEFLAQTLENVLSVELGIVPPWFTPEEWAARLAAGGNRSGYATLKDEPRPPTVDGVHYPR
jgi:hypothetical protein